MKYLVMDLYEDFECVGGKCIDTCCKNWVIYVDQRTYDTYQALGEPLHGRVCSHIEAFGDRKKIVLEEDGRCPFLNQQGLCDIYGLISPDAMCEVCQVYPRRVTKYYDLTACTLSLSCPEVARMILEKKEPIGFVFQEDQIEYMPKGDENWVLYNELINAFSIAVSILQDRGLALWQRLQLLWIETSMVQEHIDKQDLAAIRGKIECLREEGFRRECFAGRQVNPLSGLQKWTFIYKLLETTTLKGRDLAEMKILREKYSSLTEDDEETYRMWNEEFRARDHDLEYENVAVQCVFEYYMDALRGKSLYINIVKLFIMLILIRTFEVIDQHMKGYLTIEDRSLVMAQVSRMVEHSSILDSVAGQIVNGNEREALYKMICVFDS